MAERTLTPQVNTSLPIQITGNACVAIAALVFLLPFQRLLWNYAGKYLSDDRWVTPLLTALIPLWLLLLVALLCVTHSGGFDWLSLGRPALYALTVAAGLALGVVTFVFIALYIRPGFTPRILYTPVIYLVPLATGLLVLLSLNQKHAPGIPIEWLRWPWTLFAAFSLVGCAGFFGERLVHSGFRNVANFAHHILNARNTKPEHLATIARLDPERDFDELLNFARGVESSTVRDAATTKLRTHPAFVDALKAELESRSPSTALGFLHGATLSHEEQKRLAGPARRALEHFIAEIPAPNYITRDRQKQILKWGRKTFPIIIRQFADTDVDFSKILPSLDYALRPDDSRR